MNRNNGIFSVLATGMQQVLQLFCAHMCCVCIFYIYASLQFWIRCRDMQILGERSVVNNCALTTQVHASILAAWAAYRSVPNANDHPLYAVYEELK